MYNAYKNDNTPLIVRAMVRLLFLWCLLGAACPAVRSADDVWLIGNAYRNVYVALSEDLPEAQCEEVVAKLESVLSAASSLLYAASGRRVHFGTEMLVVLPSTYTTGCGKYGGVNLGTREWDYGHAPIRVTPTHPLFGDTIWTQQPRGCEAPGDFITLTPASLDDVTIASRLFVGEWAKFRWGVMEEWGHYGDYVYPPAYEQEQGQFEPTICVDAPVEYSTDGCTTAAVCTPTLIGSNNTAPTSSLLSVPSLPNVVSFCTSDTHNKEVPTKQNVLCDGRSAMEVFMQHSDYTTEPLEQPEPPALSVRAVKEFTVPAFVVFAVQLNMRKYTLQETYLLDALCQAVHNYLQDGVFFGYVYFDDTAYSLEPEGGTPLLQLDADTKTKICTDIWTLVDVDATADINVTNAIAKASELLPPEGGAVVLIAQPDAASDTTEDVAQAVAAAGGNSVWPVLYPVDEEKTQWFESVSALTGGGGVQKVQLSKATDGNKLLPVVRQDLSDAMIKVVSSIQSTQMELNSSASCSIDGFGKCKMTLPVKNQAATRYLVSVYYSTKVLVKFNPDQPQCQEMVNGFTFPESSHTYVCQTLPRSVELLISAGQDGQSVRSEVVAVEEEKPLSEATLVSVWTSTGIRDLKYTNSTAPAVFVQVLLEGRQVVDSTVTLVVQDATQDTESTPLVTLSPKDNGIGADTTGNDGIYSTYLTGLPSITSLSALTFTVSARAPAKLLPATMTLEEPIQCCGSSLQLPSDLDDAGVFLLTTVARAKVTAPPASNLPPGRVTDLRATTSKGRVGLTFTAPGADFNYGTVSKYIVTVSNASGFVVASPSFREGLVSEGQVQTLYIAGDVVECDVLQTYAVESYDEKNLGGGSSNAARHTISCSTVDPLAAGALFGIIICAILLFIILCLIIYIGCNWKRRDELVVWKALTCRLCKKDKKKKTTGKPIPAPRKSKNRPRADSDSSNDVEVIRNIGDLYSKPNIVLKHKSRNVARAGERPARAAGIDNAGFEGGGRPGHAAAAAAISTASRPMTSASSRRSSGSSTSLKKDNMPYHLKDSTLQTTLPINNVGIPVVQERAPPPSSQDSSFDNHNAFSIYPREESEDFFVGQNYPPSYSVNPHRVLDTFPSNAYGSSSSSPSTFGKPRLNTIV